MAVKEDTAVVKSGQNIDWDAIGFPVSLGPVRTTFKPTGEKMRKSVLIPTQKAVVREDTGDILQVVSNRYQLVPHRTVFEPLAQAVDDLGIKVKETTTAVGLNGGYARVEWRLDEQASIRDGDTLDIKLIARNSIDRSSRLAIELGAFRLVCSNGLVVGHGFRHSWMHFQSLSVEAAVSAFTELLQNGGPQMVQNWKNWAEVPTTLEFLEEWLKESPRRRQLVSQAGRRLVLERFEKAKQPTVWDAYNALTWYATHKLSSRNPQRLEVRRERLGQLAAKFASDAFISMN